MSSIQYYVKVENGSATEEKGVFFKATPFTILAGGKEVACDFVRNDSNHVVYRLSVNGTQVDLEHPDYLPVDVALDEAIIEALDYVEVAKAKEVDAYLGRKDRIHSFEIQQAFFYPQS